MTRLTVFYVAFYRATLFLLGVLRKVLASMNTPFSCNRTL
jgi:hypothetical protein